MPLSAGTRLGLYEVPALVIRSAGLGLLIGLRLCADQCSLVFAPFILPPVPAGYAAIPTALNNSGQTVGTYTNSIKLNWAFFLSGGEYVQFAVPGAIRTSPNAINNVGDMVGTVLDASGSHGFVRSGSHITLIDYPGINGNTSLYGINDKREMVGSYYNPSSGSHAFIYRNGVFTRLFRDDATTNCFVGGGGCDNSRPLAIDNTEQIVGLQFDDLFLMDSSGEWRVIVPGSQDTRITTADINDAGDIVWTQFMTNLSRGFLLTTAGLTTIDGGLGVTTVGNINNRGQILGFSSKPDYSGNNFIATCHPFVPTAMAILAGDGQIGGSNTQLLRSLAVRVTGADGLGVAGVTVQFSIGSGGGTLGTPSAITGPDGVAASTLTLGNIGPVSVTAAATGLNSVQFHATAVATADGPVLSILSGGSLTGPPNTTLPIPLKLQLTSKGNAVPGVQVVFSVDYGNATVGTRFAVTGSDGTAETTLTLGDIQDVIVVRGSVPGQSVLFTAWETPAQLKILKGDAQSGAGGSQLPVPLTVQPLDSSGSIIYGIPIVFSVVSGSATLTVIQSQTFDGTASASVTLGPVSGPVVVTASLDATGQSPIATFNLTNIGSQPSVSSVSNGASFRPPVVPNSFATIRGSSLATVTDMWDKLIVNGQLPTALDGVTVTIGGTLAYPNYISQGQINLVVPTVGLGPQQVVVKNSLGTSAAFMVTVSQYGPAFFQWPNSQVVATRQDFSWAVKNGTFTGVATVPAKPGDVIILWGTGFGPTTPVAPIGMLVPSDQTYSTSTLPTVTINNISATVYGAALAPGFAGLYQVAIQVPSFLTDGDYPIQASIGGVQSPSGIVLSVKN